MWFTKVAVCSRPSDLFSWGATAVAVPEEAAKKPDDGAEPAEKDASKDSGEPADDPQLVAFREGKNRPDWINRAVAPWRRC